MKFTRSVSTNLSIISRRNIVTIDTCMYQKIITHAYTHTQILYTLNKLISLVRTIVVGSSHPLYAPYRALNERALNERWVSF